MNDDQHGQVGMLFLVDAVIHRGPFNSSSNFIADFGCSTEKLAVFRKELQETKSIQFQFRVRNVFELMQPKLLKNFSCMKRKRSVL